MREDRNCGLCGEESCDNFRQAIKELEAAIYAA